MTAVSALAFAATLAACGSVPGPMMGGPQDRSSAGAGWMPGPMPFGYTLRGVACASTPSPPSSGTTVQVVVADMGMARMMGGVAPLGGHMMLRATPAVVRAGSVTFLVANMGWRKHEMVVLPLAAGQVAGQRVPGADGRVSEAGSLGEASASCAAGAGDGIESGAIGWVTLRLAAGHYELVCNLPNHYANGMRQEITVR